MTMIEMKVIYVASSVVRVERNRSLRVSIGVLISRRSELFPTIMNVESFEVCRVIPSCA